MATRLPTALNSVYGWIDPYLKTEKRGGIVNPDSPGYHTSREDLIRQGRGDNYSIQLPADQRGDSSMASGIDLTFGSLSELITVHGRLLKACRNNDPRIGCVREVIGTENGKTVSGFNRAASGSGSRSVVGYKASGFGDSSHLWHEHISVFRGRCENDNDMRGLAEIIAGLAPGGLGWKSPTTGESRGEPLPTHYVDPKKVTTFLWGVKHLTGESVKQRAPGYAINTGVQIIEHDGRKWLLTEAGYRYALDYLTTEKPTEPEPEKPKDVTNGRLVVWNVGDNSNLDKRVPKIIDGLTELKGSILALQEYGSNEYPRIYREIGEALGDYDHYLAGNRHVGWQSEKWKVLNRRKVTLKPDRQVAAVQLESKTTGARLWVFSVHLTHKAENAALRVAQTKSLITFLLSLKKLANVPILGGGDINSGGDEKDQGAVRELMRKAGYRTLVDLTGEAPATHRGTRRLDEVFFGPGVELRDVTYRYDPAASDHAAILVQFSVPNQA